MLIRKYQHIFVSCKIDKGLTFLEKWHILTRIPSSECHFWFNPILTGGGGQFDPPPLHEIRDCLATAADRDTPFHDFFLSSLAHLLIPSLRKSDHRSRGHVTFCTRTSAQNLPKICILHRFVYKTHGNY